MITFYPDDPTGGLIALGVLILGPLWNHWTVMHVTAKGRTVAPKHGNRR